MQDRCLGCQSQEQSTSASSALEQSLPLCLKGVCGQTQRSNGGVEIPTALILAHFLKLGQS